MPKTKAKRIPAAEPVGVNPFSAAHGDYVQDTIPDPDWVHGDRRARETKVILNRGGTTIERWMARDPMFTAGIRAAVLYVQGLWHLAGTSGSLVADPMRVAGVAGGEGIKQHQALAELSILKNRCPQPYWDVFENVCRWDEPAGSAGSRLASNNRSAVDAAKVAVHAVASMIVMWRGLG